MERLRRTNVDSGTEWEAAVGYSRAVRVGDRVHVSGTVATDEDGSVVGEGDPGAQARQAIDNVRSALEQAGGTLRDVVRTRVYLVDVDDSTAVGDAHAEAFGDVRPASTMLAVEELIEPAFLVEIEADAVVPGERYDPPG